MARVHYRPIAPQSLQAFTNESVLLAGVAIHQNKASLGRCIAAGAPLFVSYEVNDGFVIVAGVDEKRFEQIVAWRGLTCRRLSLAFLLLQVLTPKTLPLA